MKNKIYYIFIFSFLFICSSPFWGMLFYVNSSTHEKRMLSGVKDVRGIASLNQFIVDNHAFRDKFSNICMNTYVNFFKESPIPNQVVFGNNDWLYLGNSYNDVYNSSLGIKNITKEDIEFNLDNIHRIKQFCDSIGTDFYLAIAPNKATVYPEYLALYPNSLTRLRSYVIPTLKSKYNINAFDLYDLFEKKKKDTILYYKYDSHWNNYGAFLATKKIVNILSQKHDINLLSENDFIIEKQTMINKGNLEYDLSVMLNMHVSDTEFDLRPKNKIILEDTVIKKIRTIVTQTYTVNKTNKNNTRGFIIRDSFFIAMQPFFTSTIHESSIFKYFKKSEIMEEIERVGKPDFLIFILVERNLDSIVYQ